MANLQQHHEKALSNLQFLSELNSYMPRSYDWQVTAAFYVGVHLVNGYMKDRFNLEFTSHTAIINKLEQDASSAFSAAGRLVWSLEGLQAYAKLRNRSREARYMHVVSDDNVAGMVVDGVRPVTRSKDLRRSIQYLDQICAEYIRCLPGMTFPSTDLYLGNQLQGCTYFRDLGHIAEKTESH